MNADQLRGHLDGLVLAGLAEGPADGYAILTRHHDRSGGGFDLAEGTVYPALYRLEGAGLLSATWSSEPGSKRRRKVYELTSDGHTRLTSARAEWRTFSALMSAVLIAAPLGGTA